jgi:hypothetical protein
MTQLIKYRLVIAALFSLLTGNVGFADMPGRTALPTAIEPPQGMVLLFRVRAEGVQIYECKKDAKTGQLGWMLKAPQADLFDDRGDKFGTHSAGPVWEATDGSKIRAAMSKSSPAPDPKAIPWLLLKVTAHEGKGMFGKVQFIQRVDTWAGRPPATGCCPENVGKETRVKYQATYLFYGEKP